MKRRGASFARPETLRPEQKKLTPAGDARLPRELAPTVNVHPARIDRSASAPKSANWSI